MGLVVLYFQCMAEDPSVWLVHWLATELGKGVVDSSVMLSKAWPSLQVRVMVVPMSVELSGHVCVAPPATPRSGSSRQVLAGDQLTKNQCLSYVCIG